MASNESTSGDGDQKPQEPKSTTAPADAKQTTGGSTLDSVAEESTPVKVQEIDTGFGKVTVHIQGNHLCIPLL